MTVQSSPLSVHGTIKLTLHDVFAWVELKGWSQNAKTNHWSMSMSTSKCQQDSTSMTKQFGGKVSVKLTRTIPCRCVCNIWPQYSCIFLLCPVMPTLKNCTQDDHPAGQKARNFTAGRSPNKPVTREITIETRQKPKPWFNHVQKLWEILSWRSLFVTWVGSTPQALQADLTNSFRSGGDAINASLLPHNCHSLRRGLRITKGCQGNDPNMWHGSDFVSIF